MNFNVIPSPLEVRTIITPEEGKPVGSKTRTFCPSEVKAARFQASLWGLAIKKRNFSSLDYPVFPMIRHDLSSAVKRFFHPLAFNK